MLPVTALILLLDSSTPLIVDCKASIEQQCEAVESLASAVCTLAFKAHCEAAEAGDLVAAGDMADALSVLARASEKYDKLFRVTDASQLKILKDFLLRYAGTIDMIFTPAQFAGEGPIMEKAAQQLYDGQARLDELLARRPAVAGDPALVAISAALDRKCRELLEDLANTRLRRAHEAVGTGQRRLAAGLADQAAEQYRLARVVHPGDARSEVPLLEGYLDANLLAERMNRATGLTFTQRKDLCAESRHLRSTLDEFRAAHPAAVTTELKDHGKHIDATLAQCKQRRLAITGAALSLSGVAVAGTALGLYIGYDVACRRDAMDRCTAIPPDDPTRGDDPNDRYRRQAHAAIGLGVVGGALVVTGAALLTAGGLKSRPLRARGLALAPMHAPATYGLALAGSF